MVIKWNSVPDCLEKTFHQGIENKLECNVPMHVLEFYTFDTLSSFRDILLVNLDPTSDICRTNCFNTQVYIRHLRYTTNLNNKSQIVLRFDPAVKVTESISDYDECDLTVWIGSALALGLWLGLSINHRDL